MSDAEINKRIAAVAAGGVLFIDEAHMLEPATNRVGREIFNHIMDSAEDHRDRLTIVLAGDKHDVEQNLYGFNAGMPSRFTYFIRRSRSIFGPIDGEASLTVRSKSSSCSRCV